MNRKQATAEAARLKGLADDELIADAIYTGGLPRVQPGEIIGDIARSAVSHLVEDFRHPAARAGFATSMFSAFLLRRSGMPPLMAIATAVILGRAVEELYEMAEDVHEAVTDAAGTV